ncbi:MAG: rhamnulokinase [Lachnospiraceae bacterium]|nr:rhamnulokinase [Lachnospiraceae bacterium]
MNYYLAVDIGASSGRHMLCSMVDGQMKLEEVYRFENGMENRNGHLYWNTEKLFSEIKAGMKKCKELGKIPVSMGIDTWAVDYVLLDENDEKAGDTYGYRDSRTEGMDEKVYEILPLNKLYERTGIQKQMFNTIYQLMADHVKEPEKMKKARTFLMLPDYFHFLLTGVKKSEYTNATSTQLVDPVTKQWDYELIRMLGFDEHLFLPLSLPGTEVGTLTREIANEVGFTCKLVLPATHDTGSAVMAVPSTEENVLYISSGTWSLMGVENSKAICTPESMAANLTNEGGYEYRFRFLKNIMGLWMIQSVRHELGDAYSFAQLCEMAEECKTFPTRVDVNDAAFLAPESMIRAIRNYAEKTGQSVPESTGEIAAVIYQSLAESYRDTVKEIEGITGKHYDSIHIVGGGSNADYLNRLTAQKAGRTVYAGPGEATAIGNLAAQMIHSGEFAGLKEARECIFRSFGVRTYAPQNA